MSGLQAHLLAQAVCAPRAAAVARAAPSAAEAQHVEITGQALIAELVGELAGEALAVRQRLRDIEARISKLLDDHPDAALIASPPGMGATLTAAGLAPVLQQSGRVRYLRRANTGSRHLKRIFYRSAFCALTSSDPVSKAYYARKRDKGKAHHQAVIALARRRINVLHAIIRTRRPYNINYTPAA